VSFEPLNQILDRVTNNQHTGTNITALRRLLNCTHRNRVSLVNFRWATERVQRNPVSRLLGGVKETGFLCSILVERWKGLKETRFRGFSVGWKKPGFCAQFWLSDGKGWKKPGFWGLGGVKETGFLCSIWVERQKGLKETRFLGLLGGGWETGFLKSISVLRQKLWQKPGFFSRLLMLYLIN